MITIAILAMPISADAQSGHNVTPFYPSEDITFENDHQKYDSLGNAYLEAGDTSMAIYYLQKFIDAHPDATPMKNTVQKLKKLYISHNQSFYLKED